jgi:hypothetical protein
MGTSDDQTAANRPEDTTGQGPVTLEDRTGSGSPGSNQGKTEPVSPTGTHPEPLAAPDLESMNVGSADPQAPRHPDALRSELSGSGAYAHEPAGEQPTGLGGPGSTPDENRPVVDTTTSTGRAPGPETPVQTTTGTAHRAPGLDGATPDGESVTTDTSAGAARMGPRALDSTTSDADGPGQGDDQSVPTSAVAPAEGSSQEHQAVAGIKLPAEDGE